MKRRSDPDEWDELRERVIGLGEHSFRKTYYPVLQGRLAELERFRALLDHSTELIFCIEEPSGRVADANESACHRLGLARGDVLKLDAAILFDAPTLDALREAAVRPGAAPFEANLHSPAGITLPVELSARRVTLDEGACIGVVARDITERLRATGERRALEEQLHQAQKMEALGRLAGGIAHDFNNLLTAIIGYAECIQRRVEPGAPVRGYADSIRAAGERAAVLTRQILAFSRKQVFVPTATPVNAVIRDAEPLVRRLVGDDIEVVTALANDDVRVLADKTQLEQAIVNLCTNARDAMPSGGRLTLRARLDVLDARTADLRALPGPGAYATFEVTDTGIGMDEDTVARVFEPFFTTKEVGKGTGLGLAIVYACARQHHGAVSVESQPGRGSAFRIQLPLLAPAVAPPAEGVAAPARGGTEAVLVAEDDPDVRRLLVEILGEQGYRVIEAVDGEDAVRKFTEHAEEVRLCILDVVMPRMGGGEALAAIRARCPRVGVVFVSGYPASLSSRDGMAPGEVRILAKPISRLELLAEVRRVLDG